MGFLHHFLRAEATIHGLDDNKCYWSDKNHDLGDIGVAKKDRAHVQLSGNRSGAVSGTGAYPAVPGLVFQPWCTPRHRPGSPRPFSGF